MNAEAHEQVIERMDTAGQGEKLKLPETRFFYELAMKRSAELKLADSSNGSVHVSRKPEVKPESM